MFLAKFMKLHLLDKDGSKKVNHHMITTMRNISEFSIVFFIHEVMILQDKQVMLRKQVEHNMRRSNRTLPWAYPVTSFHFNILPTRPWCLSISIRELISK